MTIRAVSSLSIGSLPGSRVPMIAFAGDSVTQSTIGQNTALLTLNVTRGMQFWVPFLTGRRVRSSPSLNFGVIGDTTTLLLNRITAVCNSVSDFVIVQIGTNDIPTASFSTTTGNIAAIWDALLAAGKFVIALPPLPRDLSTQSSRDNLYRLIRWVEDQRYSGRRNFVVIDTASAYVDPTSATGAPKTGFSYDGLHPRARGEYYTSLKVASFLNSILPPSYNTFSTAAEAFSVDNPTGNLVTNSPMTGTGGTSTLSGTTLVGTVPTGWNFQYSANGGTISGITSTLSQITDSVTGRTGLRTAIAGSYTGAGSATVNAHTLGLTQWIFGAFTNFSAGDNLRARVEISKASATTENLFGIELQLNATMGGSLYRVGDGSVLGDPLPVDAFSGVLETPILTITATPTSLSVGVRFYLNDNANTMASQFDMYGLRLEKI